MAVMDTIEHGGADFFGPQLPASTEIIDERADRLFSDQINNAVGFVRGCLNMAANRSGARARIEFDRALAGTEVLKQLVGRNDERDWFEVIDEDPDIAKGRKTGFTLHLENYPAVNERIQEIEQRGPASAPITAAARFVMKQFIPEVPPAPQLT